MNRTHQKPDRDKRAQRIIQGYNIFRLIIVIAFIIVTMYLMNK